MAEPTDAILTQIITGILTGGAGAATSLLGVFRKTKQRLDKLEEDVGREEPVKSGLRLAVFALEETVKKLKREVDSWEDDPPEWAERLFARRARSASGHDLSSSAQYEEAINRQMRSFNERLSRSEDDQEEKLRRLETNVERRMAEEPDGMLLTREEYLLDSRSRAEEMAKIRESLATVNGLLRGVMAALNFVDTPPDPSDPPLRPIPRPPPRTGR